MTTDRTYHLTAAGTRALESEQSVPAWYRTILGLIRGDTTSSVIIGGMSTHPKKEVLTWLDQLETLGFVELVVPASSKPPAEVTTDFGFDVVLARMRAA